MTAVKLRQISGSVLNGHKSNGIHTNGVTLNGTNTNGTETNGTDKNGVDKNKNSVDTNDTDTNGVDKRFNLDETLIVFWSSGTTGRPKGIMHAGKYLVIGHSLTTSRHFLEQYYIDNSKNSLLLSWPVVPNRGPESSRDATKY